MKTKITEPWQEAICIKASIEAMTLFSAIANRLYKHTEYQNREDALLRDGGELMARLKDVLLEEAEDMRQALNVWRNK